MAESQDAQTEDTMKPSKLPLILGLILAIVGGGGAYYAVYSGLILAEKAAESERADAADGAQQSMNEPHIPVGDEEYDLDFVPVEPMVISLGRGNEMLHLRFRAQLEVNAAKKAEVEHLLPRVVDVLNGYLRALEVADIQDRAALIKIRSQMLRRVQVVTGPGRVNDLLVMEFVMN